MRIHVKDACRRALIVGEVAMLSCVAQAQDAPGPTPEIRAEPEPQEIIVTAQRRSESLQKVPVSITAFTDDQLKDLQVTAPTDLGGVVPNLVVQSPLGESVPIFSLRGITMADTSIGQDGPVAVYSDEVYKGNVAILGLPFFDLERVEVLKGPQGTLYGRNTTGGAVNFITKRPDFTTSGQLSIGYGNYNRIHADGAAQTALGDTIAVRLAGTFEHADGWIKNLAPGQPNLESTRQYAWRATILFKPNDRFNLTLRASTSLQNPLIYGVPGPVVDGAAGVGAPYYPAHGANGVLLQPFSRDGLGPREVDVTNPQHRLARADAVAVSINYNINTDLALTSISSWDRGVLHIREDADGTPLRVIDAQYDGTTRQIAEDLRLTSNYEGPANFIVGFNYNNEKIFNTTRLGFLEDIDVNGDGVVNYQDCLAGGLFEACDFRNQFDQVKTGTAGYGDGSYKFNDDLKLHAGLRYTHDTGELLNAVANVYGPDGVFVANTIPGTPGAAAPSLQFTNDNVSGKAGIDYTPRPQLLLYASYGTGYRGASFNQQFFFSPVQLTVAKPEELRSIEVGFKTQWASRRIGLNGAIFDYEYRNEQFLNVDPVTAVLTLVNVPQSRILGAELESPIRVTGHLTLSSGLGLLDSKIIRGTSGEVDLHGNRLPNAPGVTATEAIDWRSPISGILDFAIHLDGTYTAKQYYDLLNAPTTTQHDYFMLNGNVRFADPTDRKSVSLWVKNATNAFYYTNLADLSGFGYAYAHVNPPRTFGATMSVIF